MSPLPIRPPAPALRAALAALLLGAGAAGAAGAQAPVADAYLGSWQGTLRPGAATLRLVLTVRRDSAGGLAGALTSVDQGNTTLPAAVALQGDSLVVTVSAAQARWAGVLAPARDSLRGTFTQGPGSLPLAFGRASGAAPAPAARPQDPKPPFPYRTEEVTVASVAGVQLAGTLTLPAGTGPFPVAVLVSGSGPQDRDETLLGHRPFLVLADHLARRGIATLRYDDRGTARSTGNFAAATSADFADDAEAAVRWLRTRPEVARDRVGIIGHSEGGLVGPMVAARSRDVAFVVMLAGPGIRGDSLLALQGAAVARASGAPAAMADSGAAANRRLFAAIAGARDSVEAATRFDAVADTVAGAMPAGTREALRANLARGRGQLLSPWMRWFLAHDPQPTLRRVRQPVLALNGTLDVQVPWEANLPAIRAALAAAGNRDHREVELPGLNHLFQTARTGGPGEYAQIEETMAPAALNAVSDWIAQRFVKR